MDIVKGLFALQNRRYQLGDNVIIKYINEDMKDNYDIKVGDIAVVTRMKGKAGISCPKGMRLFCDKTDDRSCILFKKRHGHGTEEEHIWSCYCEVERV